MQHGYRAMEDHVEDIRSVLPQSAMSVVFSSASSLSVLKMVGRKYKLVSNSRGSKKVAALRILAEYLDRKSDLLSGGQRRRVAVGRAIILTPKVFPMGTPLSNLDAKLRVQTRTLISALT